MSILYVITTYIIRFAIALLPFLGFSGVEADTQPPAETEFNMDMKSGGGEAPMYINDSCNYCPPMC